MIAAQASTETPSTIHFRGRIALMGMRVSRAVAEVVRSDPARVSDPFRGLYLDEATATGLLRMSRAPLAADPEEAEGVERLDKTARCAEADGHECRLLSVTRRFALTPLDADVLLLALLPDIDARYERLYGFLHDDISVRRASIGLLLDLCGRAASDGEARARFAPGASLSACGLVEMESGDGPFLRRTLRVPDRVTAHLLGDDALDVDLTGLLDVRPAPAAGSGGELARRLGEAIGKGATSVYVHGAPGSPLTDVALQSLDRAGYGVVRLDAEAALSRPDPYRMGAAAGREAVLRGAGVVAGPLQETADAGVRALLAGLTRSGRVPAVLTGPRPWDARWGAETPLTAEVLAMTFAEREPLWRTAFAEVAGGPPDMTDLHSYRLDPGALRRVAVVAARQAALAAEPVTATHVREAVRATAANGLARLTRRVGPAVGWDDLVIDPPVLTQLRELCARARHRDTVLNHWRMRPGGGRGRSVTALFSGDSGTGKTFAAEVLAGDLGVDLYVVNLATVVDKYVGETEKNLQRIFDEADVLDAVLLFDEADALFGKRSDVADARDRYANIETAFLLQRMESFDGLAILTTNLPENLDQAFTRRLDAEVRFAPPDQQRRRALWERSLRPPLPTFGDLGLDTLSEKFALTGGSIAACALAAAYRAAEARRPVTRDDLVYAVRAEYHKLGRLMLDEDFVVH